MKDIETQHLITNLKLEIKKVDIGVKKMSDILNNLCFRVNAVNKLVEHIYKCTCDKVFLCNQCVRITNLMDKVIELSKEIE